MVLCYSDLFPGNFIIDDEDNITIIDFSDTSIVPSSFVKYALWDHRLGFDISQWVYIPTSEGVDNFESLLSVQGRMVIGPSSYAKLGRRLRGGDKESQESIKEKLQFYDTCTR
jgi:hypothetical protein